MLNSSNYQREENVLQVGVTIPADMALLNDPKAKVFYHRVPGARYILKDGAEIRFMGGMFVTASDDIIAELNKIADNNTSMVYTKEAGKAAIDKLVNDAAADAMAVSGDSNTLSNGATVTAQLTTK